MLFCLLECAVIAAASSHCECDWWKDHLYAINLIDLLVCLSGVSGYPAATGVTTPEIWIILHRDVQEVWLITVDFFFYWQFSLKQQKSRFSYIGLPVLAVKTKLQILLWWFKYLVVKHMFRSFFGKILINFTHNVLSGWFKSLLKPWDVWFEP